jgi:Fur family iron response transcriptional regulator
MRKPNPGESYLRSSGLRPTRQRVALGELLFGKGDRHVTSEMLYAEANQQGIEVSLATVYNTLNHLVKAGLLRRIAVHRDRSYFDTNTSHHFHFFCEDTGELFDIDSSSLEFEGSPRLPDGTEVCWVDVVVRLRPKR